MGIRAASEQAAAIAAGISPCVVLSCNSGPAGAEAAEQRHARIGMVVVIKLASVYSTQDGDDASTYCSERSSTTNDQHGHGDINNRHTSASD